MTDSTPGRLYRPHAAVANNPGADDCTLVQSLNRVHDMQICVQPALLHLPHAQPQMSTAEAAHTCLWTQHARELLVRQSLIL